MWKEFVYHPFVMAMGDGTLPLESFKGYIIQDYLYLVSVNPAQTEGTGLSLIGALCPSECACFIQVKEHRGHH